MSLQTYSASDFLTFIFLGIELASTEGREIKNN